MLDDKTANVVPNGTTTDQALSKQQISKGFSYMHEYFILAVLYGCLAGSYLVLFLHVRT